MTRAIGIAALTAGVALAGCGSSGDGGLTKAGSETKRGARVLTMETTDLALYDDPGLAAFPKLVERRSGGRMKVRLKLVTYEELKGGTRLEHLRRGDADLGWDNEGLVDIARAWYVPGLPFLIDSFELQRALIAGEYDEKLLATMEGTSLEGVAMFPGDLARPWSLGAPIRTLADWKRVRMWNSQAGFPLRDRVMRTLGTHVENDGDTAVKLLRRGRLNALDWISRGLQINAIGNHGVVGTLNVATGTRPVAIIGNRRRLARLDADERRWLREAAAEAVQVSLRRVGGNEPELFALNCRSTRMRAVLAPQAEVAAMREQVRPIYAAVKDPSFRELYELIEATRKRIGPVVTEVPNACRGPVPRLPVVETSTRPRALDGQYRFALDLEDFRRAGMKDDIINQDYAGIWTARLKKGRGSLVRRATENALSDEPLRLELEYRVGPDRVTFAVDTSPPFTLQWRDTGGALSYRPVHPLDWFNTALFGAEWARVR